MYNIKFLFDKDKTRLFFIFLKNVKTEKKKMLKDFISQNYYKSDNEFYRLIDQNFDFDITFGASKLKCLDNIDKNFNINTYLDIGCHKGMITKSVSEYFDIKKENIYGTDVEKHRDFSFKFEMISSNKLNFDDNMFDLITCFMVLHHCDYYETLIKEAFRIMKPGGIMILKEHDCAFKNDKVVLDVLHNFYDKVLYKDANNWYCDYKPQTFWTNLLISNGFKLLFPIEIKCKKINPLRNYVAIFVKPV